MLNLAALMLTFVRESPVDAVIKFNLCLMLFLSVVGGIVAVLLYLWRRGVGCIKFFRLRVIVKDILRNWSQKLVIWIENTLRYWGPTGSHPQNFARVR